MSNTISVATIHSPQTKQDRLTNARSPCRSFNYKFSICSVITELFYFDRDFNIDITGLGILDWLVSHIVTWVVNLFDETIVGMLESRLRAYIDEMLPNLTLPTISWKNNRRNKTKTLVYSTNYYNFHLVHHWYHCNWK